MKKQSLKRFDVVTIFPRIFNAYFGESILKRAQEIGAVKIVVHNLRDYTSDKHRTVDDVPYGGGAGMILKVKPIFECVQSIKLKAKSHKPRTRTILFSAKGKRFTQRDAKRLSKYDQLILICGRYEGVDERVAENIADEEISIGDFVLTGGEVPAMALVDSVTRLIPGVLGNAESLAMESHSRPGIKEYPHYTRPKEFQSWSVPAVLRSGNHKEIERWRDDKTRKQKKR